MMISRRTKVGSGWPTAPFILTTQKPKRYHDVFSPLNCTGGGAEIVGACFGLYCIVFYETSIGTTNTISVEYPLSDGF